MPGEGEVCTAKGGMRGEGGHAWQGSCMVGGHVWQGGGVHAAETATEAGGTRPTGVHSYTFCNRTH